MTETLSKAWSLFDAGNYTEAESLYKDCYAKTPSTDPEEKHIAVHQAGMTERMAGDPYSVEEVQELLKNISSIS